MKKFMSIFTVFMVMTLLFIGCTEPGPGPGPGPGDEDDPMVTGISLRIAKGTDSPSASQPTLLAPGAVRTVSANVVVVNGAATTYTITLEDWDDDGTAVESAATLEQVGTTGSYTLTVKPDAVIDVDQIRIVATSTANGANGTPVKAEWLIPVKDDPTEIEVSDWAFVIYNVADDATVEATNTTTELPAATNGRYVISNDISTASADSGITENSIPAILRDSTFVYLNKGFLLENGNYGMEMRVKIIGNGDGTTDGLPQTSNTAHGFVIGAFKDPESFIVGETDMQFAGIRNTLSGQLSRYGSRSGNTPSSGNLTSSYVGLNARQHDVDPVKVEGFIEQEYIYKISCSNAGVFLVEIYTPDGSTKLADYTLSGGANVGDYLGNENNFAYLGIAVVQATVEISAIKYFEGSANWIDSETGTTAMRPVLIKRAAIQPEKNPSGDVNYTDLFMEFPDEGLQLNVLTVPRSAMDYASTLVAWNKTADSNSKAGISGTGLLTMSGASEVTIGAALSGANIDTSTAGSAIPFKLNIQADLNPVTTVTVAAAAGYTTVVEAGNGTYTGDTLDLTAATDAGARSDGITWEVKAADGTSATAAATIAATGGAGSWDQAFATATLTAAANLATETTVKVYAISQYGASNTPVRSTAFEVTVKPWSDVKVYNFNDAIYNTVTGGTAGTFRRIGGLDFDGNFGADQSGQSATIDTYSFQRALNTGGGAMSTAGAPNGRRVAIPLKGPAKVTLYGYTNSDNTIRNAVLNNDRDAVMWNEDILISGANSPLFDNKTTAANRVNGLAVLLARNNNDSKTAAAGSYASGLPGDHEVVLWAVGSVCYWGVEVDYSQGGTPPTAVTTTWGFGNDSGLGDAPNNWVAYAPDNLTNSTDATLAQNGLSLVVNGSVRAMRWIPTQTGGGWTGAIQTTGEMTTPVMSIANVQGPFTVTVNYTGTGSGQTGRFADITVGDVVTSGQEVDATTGKTATYTYTGTGTPTISITRRGGDLRFYQVIVEQTN